MTTKITLVSGNVFYYTPETDDRLSCAWVLNTEKVFLGAFIAQEADRKVKIFSALPKVIIEAIDTIYLENIEGVSLDWFTERLESASPLFKRGWHVWVNDQELGRQASACSDRQVYLQAVGVKSESYHKEFPIWGIVGNHVSLFGWENFRKTFFGTGKKEYADTFNSEFNIDKKVRYPNYTFQPPASYFKNLVRNAVGL